jgi:hypothetical protein
MIHDYFMLFYDSSVMLKVKWDSPAAQAPEIALTLPRSLAPAVLQRLTPRVGALRARCAQDGSAQACRVQIREYGASVTLSAFMLLASSKIT